jgi:hypothetical protein
MTFFFLRRTLAVSVHGLLAPMLAAAVLVVGAPGCGDDDGSVPLLDGGALDAGAPPDGGFDAGADAGPPRVHAGATDAPLDLAFTAAVTGNGMRRIGAIAIDGSVGTIEIYDELYDVLVYEKQPWGKFDLVLLQGLAVREDDLAMVWFYCDGEALVAVFSESVEGLPLLDETATGICAYSDEPSIADVALPAVDLAYPELVPGYTISGADVEYDGVNPGFIRWDSSTYELLPFELVDCTETCGGTGWWELHVALLDRATARACVGVVYLMLDRPTRVAIEYAICLPDLADPTGGRANFIASWTSP